MQPSTKKRKKCSSELNVPPGKKRKKVKLDYEESTKKRKKCSSELNVQHGKKRKKVNNIFENEEIEMIQSYYEDYNKSNSENIEEKTENVKSLRDICKEKLDSISRNKRIYVKTVLPVKNTIRYTEYKRKSALEKFQFLKQNSTEVISDYKSQYEKGKKLKEQNEANQAQINQYSNERLAYDFWKSNLKKSLKPKKVEPTFKTTKVQPHIEIQQIEIDKIEEIDKIPQHKSIIL